MPRYPVELDVVAPVRYDRLQLLVRLLVLFVLGFLGLPLGWVFVALYLLLPVVAAVAIGDRGGAGYLTTTGRTVERGLAWFLGLLAYLMLLVDRLPLAVPTAAPTSPLRLAMHPIGRPTAGSALVRLVTSLPVAFLLALLGVLSALLWLVGVVAILVAERVPEPIYGFQRGLLRAAARFLAYHASLVDAYPPLALDTGREPRAPTATPAPS